MSDQSDKLPFVPPLVVGPPTPGKPWAKQLAERPKVFRAFVDFEDDEAVKQAGRDLEEFVRQQEES